MERLLDTVKEWLAVSNPGLVRREDLAELERQLDELLTLVDEIEAALPGARAGAADVPEPE